MKEKEEEIAYSQVTGLIAVVATTTSSSSTTQPESRTIRLDVTESLAVVALLRFGCPGQRALVGLVAGLLA